MTSLQSTFESMPLDDLILLLTANRATGVVRVHGDQACELWFVDGALTYATRDDDAPLRVALAKAGLIDDEHWELASSSPDPGAALLAQSGVDSPRLRTVFRERLVDTLFPLLIVPEASFEFYADERHDFGAALAWNGHEVVDRARLRLEEWRTLASSIPSLAALVSFIPSLAAGVDALTISATDWSLVARIDGRRSVSELVRESGLSAFEVCVALHRLSQAGAVRFDEPT
jgi:hypothetical protein